jgi:threonylcarbamoyladenosine tRNA methylthiotransferase CDKAL1
MRVFITSFGCSTNLADGEVLGGCLARAGYELVDSASSADIVVYNTCAVKGPTESRIVEALKRIPKSKKLVVAGCLPSVNLRRLLHEVRFDGIVGPAAGESIVEVVDRVAKGERINVPGSPVYDLPKLTLPRLRSSSVVSIVPISYGCLGSCAYCCVVLARGRLRSYAITDIVHRVKDDLKLGFQEFWLTSQDVACYGRDKDTNVAELLRALCAVEGDFKVRVGMMTPNMVMDMLEDLPKAFEDEHVFKFLHLPVQSGDDDVLKSMCRFYSAKDFREVVDAFRRRFSKLTLATDVICGFPGEDDAAFGRTLQLMEQVEPDIVNVSKFFARPNTPAVNMKERSVPLAEIKKRSTKAAALAKSIAIENNQRWVGWKGRILVDEKGKTRGSWVGRNFAYKPVTIRTEENIMGKSLSISVTDAFPTYLEGRQA